MAQAFRTQNLRLLGNLFDKNNSLGAKGYSLYSTGDGTAWKADQNEESGILSGGVLSIGTGSTISVSAGTGQIYGNTLVSSEIVTTVTNVSWSAFTNVSLNYLATKQFTYLYIDNFGALVQSNTVFSDSVFKNYIVIGIVIHLNNTTIDAVINSQNVGYGDAHRLYELYSSFGPMKRSGLSLSASGATLKINRADGTVLLIGCNYTVNQFEPDISTLTSYTDVKFARVRTNGSGGFTFDSNSGSLYTVVDPNNYDNGTGTLASVTAGYWTIQRFYLFPNVDDRLANYYGVATYATLSDALVALPNENFTESSFTARDAVFLGYLIVKQGVTDLSNSGNAKFLQAGLSRSLSAPSSAGGSGGSTVTALDDLTDVQITTPLGGQFLTYDSGSSLWKNRSFILDANNNELIKFPSTVASAVNELTISNTATTGSPSISATGGDTNIGLNLISKGTGLVQINGKAISLANSFTTIGNFSLAFETTASTSLTLPTSGILATTSQIPTVYDNTLTLAGDGGISLSGTPTFTANASADKTITISIADGALAIAKLANIATLRILGRTSGSSGPVQELDGSGVVTVIGLNAVTRTENIEGGNPGQIPYQSAANTTLFSAAGTANQVLLSGGTGAPTWASQSSLSVGSATTAGSLANALTISSPLTGTSYNGSSAVSIGLQNASDVQAGGVSIGPQTFAGNKTFKDNVIISGDLTVNGSTVTINSSTLSVDDKNIELGAVIAIASLSSAYDINAGSDLVIVNSTTGLIVGQALTKTGGTGAFGASPTIASIISATQFTVTPVHATTGSIIFSVGGATDVTADGGGITLKGTTNKTIIWVDATDAWTLSEHINIASGKVYRINGNDVLSSTTLGSGIVNSSLTSVGTLTNLTVTNTITGSVSGSAGSLSGTYTFWGQSFNGTQNVSGNLTSVGNITGTGGITITAGGSNQNVVLTPSGTGYTLLNGSVGIGNSTPNNKLTIQAGDDKDSGPIINLGGNAINQFESGRIRFTEVVTGTAPFYQGAYLHYDGSNNLFHIGVHDDANSLIAGDTNAISIVRSSGNVGIGTTSPNAKLYVSAGTLPVNQRAMFINADITTNTSVYTHTLNLIDGATDANPTSLALGTYSHVVFRNRAATAGSVAGILDIYTRGASTDPTVKMTVTDVGNVGIGHTSPNNKLAISGSVGIGSNYNVAAPANGLIVEGNVAFGLTNPSTYSSQLTIETTQSRAVMAFNTALADAGTLYGLGFGYAMSNYNSAYLSFYKVGNSSTSNRLSFSLWNQNDILNINGAGNVGIGITIPTAKLHINSTTSGATLLRADGTNGTLFSVVDDLSDSLMSVNNSAGLPVLEVFADDRIVAGQYGQNDLVVINNKVGIGTASPSNTLDVNGTARIRSISASGSAATIFLTTDANGVLISRTAAQVRSDIGAGTGNGTVTSVTGSGGLASSGGTTPDISIATDGVTTAKILNSNVTLAKIQNIAISSVLGNSSPSAAQAPVEINMTTLATMLSGKTMDIVGNATNVTGVVAIANGGTGTATTTANAFFVGPNGSSGAPSFRVMAIADIPTGMITFAKLQDVAGPTLIGRISATAGPVAALTSANARTAIGATTVGSNLITLTDPSAIRFIRVNADNTVSTLSDVDFRTAIGAGTGSGTVTSVTGTAPIASSGGTTPAISLNDAGVTYAKIQNVSATSRILGRITGSAGVIEELTGANVATIIGASAIENATNVNITTDDATNSSYYLYFGANASGNTPLKASTKIRYNPNTGAFSATTKSFRIPHPTKSEHDLVYGSLESPYHGIRLTGKGKTKGNRAEIILPDYVKVLIDKETINIQLSVIKCAKILYIDDIIIDDNKFTVKYDKSWYEKSKDVEFYWDFTAERKDVPKLIVEEKL